MLCVFTALHLQHMAEACHLSKGSECLLMVGRL